MRDAVKRRDDFDLAEEDDAYFCFMSACYKRRRRDPRARPAKAPANAK